MTQTFTRFLRIASVVLLTAVCTTRLGATTVVSNLVNNAGPVSTELTTSVLTTTPGDNDGVPGVAPTVNLSPVNALCYNAKNGSIATTVIGDAPFTFAWSNGKTTQNLNNIGAGTYTVTVTDTDGESTVTSTTVGQPAAIVAYINCMAVCPNTCNGYAHLVVLSGGTAPYTYQWSNGSTNVNLDGLCPGVYWVTITDANGCKKIVGAAISITTPVTISGVATNASCANPCSGTITQTVSGACPPYTYAWSNGASTKNLANLCAGIYTVTVTSFNGCTAEATYEITAPPGVEVTVIPTNPICYYNTGSLATNGSGGTAPVQYLWSNGSTSDNISVSDESTYCVTITDANGCTAEGCGSIVIPDAISIAVDTVTCTPWPGTACGGSAGTIVSGGVAPFDYAWSNGGNDASNNTLCAGPFSVTVTDENGCTASTEGIVDICPPIPCTPAAEIVSIWFCGETSRTLSVVGGFNDSTSIYNWYNLAGDPLGSDATLTVTANGTYVVVITDEVTPCISSDTITIELVPAPSVDVTTTPVSCNDGSNGTASAIATGGTGAYIFVWDNGATGDNLSELSAGNYCVTVYDANQCSATDCGEVTEPAPLSIDVMGTNGTCTNPCGGSIEVTANGGTAPYAYNWSDSTLSGSSLVELCAGTYCVTVIDANGCSATGCVEITAPTGIDVEVSSTNPTCYNYTNGSASATVIGGTAPYTYAWSNGKTTAAINNIGAGTYTVTVTDANGCTATGTVNLVAPPKIIAYVNCIKTCPGECNGTANLTVIGGTPPYTYQWTTGATTEDIDSLCVGVYWVTITDANGCHKIVGAAVLSLPPVVINGTVTNVLCAGSCSGGITLSVTGGGSATYTYIWSNGSTVKNQTGLCTGEYCVTVTSTHGCTSTACFEVTSTPPVEVTVDTESPLCAPGSGSATANVSGGTAPFQYLWSNGSTESSINELEAGSYCVTVTDANGCTATGCGSVTVPEILTVNAEGTSPLCAPGSGSATASANGGTGAISYAWSNGATDASIDGLETGSYCVTVTDENGCTATDCVDILVPTVLTVDVDANDQLCFDDNMGSVNSIVSGGTPPYAYLWSNGATTANIEGLGFGLYSLTVTDANGCTAMDMDVVSSPLPLAAIAIPLPATCYGYDNGSIDLMVMGGTAPYAYNWSNGATTEDLENLVAGTYSVTVTDANNCSTTASGEVLQPTEVVATATSTDLNCYNICDGTASVSATGGTTVFGIYTYEWSNGETTEAIADLCAGTYTVTVTDLVGCFDVVTVVITEPTPLEATAAPTDASCPEACNGAAVISIEGGTAPYTVNWSNGAVGGEVMELCAGTYTFTVTDENGCTVEGSVTINAPVTLTVSSDATDLNCYNGWDGTVTATATGGTEPYSIVWDNGSTEWTIMDLAAGTYCFTVTDANGCTASACDTVNEPEQLLALIACPCPLALCPGDCGFAADLEVFGGTPPYSYEWSNGATTQDVEGLCAGIYSVTVTDALGCTFEVLSAPFVWADSINATSETTNVTCTGLCNGSATVNATGGFGSLSIVWSTGDSTWTVSNLCDGEYCYTITDAIGCTYTGCVNIEEPAPLTVQVTGVDVLCPTGASAATGSATAVANGGTGAYSYIWSNGATTATIEGLETGNYCVTVYDANQCSATGCDDVNAPTPLDASAESTDITCYGVEDGTITVFVTGGTEPYAYAWANGNTTNTGSGLGFGTYQITVTDANGCTAVAEATIEEPTQLTAEANPTNVTCPGLCDGAATVSISGGTPGYTVTWSDSALVGGEVMNLCAGTYTFTVTDAHGCTTEGSVTITAPEELAIEVVPTNILCADDNNGEVSVSVTGGTPDYTIVWADGGTDFSIGGLAPGEYCFTVTDANGCTADGCASIAQPEPLIAFSVCPDTVLCPNTCNGSILVTASGGVPPYTYEWNDGSTDEDRFELCAGIYIVTITDANGCEFILAHELTGSTPLALTFESTAALCQIDTCNGTATAIVTGGVEPYTYAWEHGPTTAFVDGLCGDASYFVTVTDANGCTTEGSVYIECVPVVPCVPDTIIISGAPECGDESVTLEVAGANPFGTYLWNNGATTSTLVVTENGTYSVTVTVIDVAANTICESIDSIDVVFYEAPTASSDATDVTCYNGSNGAITVAISGGTPPYTVDWSNGEVGGELANLTAGVYCYTVTDLNGCTTEGCDTVNEPEPLLGYVDCPCPLALCPGDCSGEVNLTVVGGVGPFTFNWSNGATTEDLSNLCAGFYEVTITDANGCTFDVAHAPFEEADPIEVSVESTNPSCANGWNGSITLNISGGTEPYDVQWTGGYTGATITDLVAGEYCYTITDAIGCTAEGCVTLIDGEPLLGYVDCPCSYLLCPGECTGAIDLTVVGGTAPFIYNWSNGATTEDVANLCIGDYSVTITDANGCTTDVYHAPFEEAENCDSTTTPLDIFGFSVFNDTDCGDETCDGVIVLTVSGGVQPYSYAWSNGATDGTLTDLCEGMYSYTVTDAVGNSGWNMLNVGCNEINPVRMAENALVDNVIVTAAPNPFSANSVINFALPVDDSNVTLEVYSVTGQKVAELFRGSVKANATYNVTLDGGQMADGMYIYRLVTSGGAYTGNLVRVKN